MKKGSQPGAGAGKAGPTKARITQAAVVPILRSDDGIRVVLVTSRKRQRWIFPKGIVDPGNTPAETGLQEAFEEAGIAGRIVGDPLGSYEDTKWGGTIEVTVFLMEVENCLDHWAESHMRQRHFAPLAEAEALLTKPAHKAMMRTAVEQLA